LGHGPGLAGRPRYCGRPVPRAAASGIGGRTIAYTGDTAWTDTLIDVADGTDLLIAEAYFWDKPVPYHLRHADLVEHRTQITSARMILTHMSTDMLAHAGAAEFE